MQPIYARMLDANVRIEGAWPFPISPAPDDLLRVIEGQDDDIPAALAELIRLWSDEEKDQLFSGDCRDGRDAFDDLVSDALRADVSGWIGLAAVPVFEPLKDGCGASFSWGRYNTKLFFAPSADELLTAAAEWGEAKYESALAKTKQSA